MVCITNDASPCGMASPVATVGDFPAPQLAEAIGHEMEPRQPRLRCTSFNQDRSCVAVGSSRGYEIYSTSPFASCHRCVDAGVSVVEMLHCSSLIALVGAGEQPGESPRRLRLWNTRTDASICELNFSSAVLGVRMSRTRLVAALESRVHVFDLSSMRLLHTLETAPNAHGLAGLSVDDKPCNAAVLAPTVGEVARARLSL